MLGFTMQRGKGVADGHARKSSLQGEGDHAKHGGGVTATADSTVLSWRSE